MVDGEEHMQICRIEVISEGNDNWLYITGLYFSLFYSKFIHIKVITIDPDLLS